MIVKYEDLKEGDILFLPEIHWNRFNELLRGYVRVEAGKYSIQRRFTPIILYPCTHKGEDWGNVAYGHAMCSPGPARITINSPLSNFFTFAELVAKPPTHLLLT